MPYRRFKHTERQPERAKRFFRLPFAAWRRVERGRDGSVTAKAPRAGTPRCAAW